MKRIRKTRMLVMKAAVALIFVVVLGIVAALFVG